MKLTPLKGLLGLNGLILLLTYLKPMLDHGFKFGTGSYALREEVMITNFFISLMLVAADSIGLIIALLVYNLSKTKPPFNASYAYGFLMSIGMIILINGPLCIWAANSL